MASTDITIRIIVTKFIVKVIVGDVRGEVEKISQNQDNSHFLVLFLIFLSTFFQIIQLFRVVKSGVCI